MIRHEQPQRLASLIDRLLRLDLPSAVHLANQPGTLPDGRGTLDMPRFSICLSGSAAYHVIREGQPVKITLSRGEALAAAPGCLMEPYGNSRYLALGIVFTPEMTRFLLARKDPGSHRFLLAHHSSATLDEETAFLFKTLTRHTGREPGSPYLRKFLQLLLIKARELSDAEADTLSPRKAWFTWRSACQFIQENFSQPIDRTDVARFLQLHPNHLSRLFTRFSGGSFNHYLLGIRLRHAEQLLKNPALNISEIGRACGFTDTNYFIRCHRKQTGRSPGKARHFPGAS